MVALLTNTRYRVLELKEAGTTSKDNTAHAQIRIAAYSAIIADGHVCNPAAPPSGKRGSTANTTVVNLVGRLEIYVDDRLRFATDFPVGFDKHDAER